MKASLCLRDDAAPLLRAKLPITLFNLPAVASLTAGEPSELRLAVATAGPSLPSLHLSYAPNNPTSPLSLSLLVGSGPGGSPAGSAVTLAAELRGNGIAFSLLFKPRLGDFTVRKRYESGQAPSASEVTMRSVLPVRGGAAAVRFRWGVRIPAEVTAGAVGEEVGVSLRRLPYLVAGKVTVERTWRQTRPPPPQPPPMARGQEEESLVEKVRREVEELREASTIVAARRGGRRSGGGAAGRSPDMVGKGKAVEVEEELRKALMGDGR